MSPAVSYHAASAYGHAPRCSVYLTAHQPAPFVSRRRDFSIVCYRSSGVLPALHNQNYVLRPGKPGNLKVYIIGVMQASGSLAGHNYIWRLVEHEDCAIPVLSSFLQEKRAKTPPVRMKSAVRLCHGSCIMRRATTRANAERHLMASSQFVSVIRTRCSIRHGCCNNSGNNRAGQPVLVLFCESGMWRYVAHAAVSGTVTPLAQTQASGCASSSPSPSANEKRLPPLSCFLP